MSVKEVLQGLTPKKQMSFSPVPDDDDELSGYIKDDPQTHDNNWDLTAEIDGAKLEAFWDEALQELGPLEAEQQDEL